MTTDKKLWMLLLVGVAAFALALGGCSASDDDNGNDGGIVEPPTGDMATCEGCHTSEAMLKATALPDPDPPESEGEG